MSHSVAACLGAAHLRAAPSRPERAALVAVEALGWMAGRAEPDLSGCMGMKAAAGQWAVYWYPGGRPREARKKGEAYLSVCPQEELLGLPTLRNCNHPQHKLDNAPIDIPGIRHNYTKLLIRIKAIE